MNTLLIRAHGYYKRTTILFLITLRIYSGWLLNFMSIGVHYRDSLFVSLLLYAYYKFILYNEAGVFDFLYFILLLFFRLKQVSQESSQLSQTIGVNLEYGLYKTSALFAHLLTYLHTYSDIHIAHSTHTHTHTHNNQLKELSFQTEPHSYFSVSINYCDRSRIKPVTMTLTLCDLFFFYNTVIISHFLYSSRCCLQCRAARDDESECSDGNDELVEHAERRSFIISRSFRLWCRRWPLYRERGLRFCHSIMIHKYVYSHITHLLD